MANYISMFLTLRTRSMTRSIMCRPLVVNCLLRHAPKGGGGDLLCPFLKSVNQPWFRKRKPWLCPSLDWIFHSKCCFKSIQEKKLQTFSLWRLLTICFMKRPNSAKPPMPWKISGSTPVTEYLLISVNHRLYQINFRFVVWI